MCGKVVDCNQRRDLTDRTTDLSFLTAPESQYIGATAAIATSCSVWRRFHVPTVKTVVVSVEPFQLAFMEENLNAFD